MPVAHHGINQGSDAYYRNVASNNRNNRERKLNPKAMAGTQMEILQ